jgi:hypothetical protein
MQSFSRNRLSVGKSGLRGFFYLKPSRDLMPFLQVLELLSFERLLAHFDLASLFSVHELVIAARVTIPPVLVHELAFPGVILFLVYTLLLHVISSRITITRLTAKCHNRGFWRAGFGSLR